MANLVYNMVCDAFAGLISRKAAENLVKDALRDIGSHPDRVTALEMQELLRKGIFKRLQRIIPVMKAKGEIKQLLRRLEKTLAQPMPMDDSEDWAEPEVGAVDLAPWEMQAPGMPPQTDVAQPDVAQTEVAQTEVAHAETTHAAEVFERVQQELSLAQPLEVAVGITAAPRSSSALPEPALRPALEGSVLTSLNAQAPLPPVAPSWAGDPTMSTEDSPPVFPPQAVIAPPAALTAAVESPPALDPELDLGGGFDEDLFGDAGDLFEFEEVDLAALTTLTVPVEPRPALREGRKQEEILSRLALESGVSDVLLSTRLGALLNSRMGRSDPLALAAAVARAAAGAEGGMPPGLFYADLDEHFILVAPLDDQVLLSVLAAPSTNLGRLMADIVSLKEEL